MPNYHPIVYLRGYAMTQGEIDDTVATPYMGFNLGSTLMRQDWEGNPVNHVFESPLVRLMKDHGYRDVYLDGKVMKENLPDRPIVIHRYYDEGSTTLGSGVVPTIEDAARGLKTLLRELRAAICGDDKQATEAFRVYLVAHSMGGLVLRCFLQKIGSRDDRRMVDKAFTYATPHNGIEVGGVNVPAILGARDINNFNRDRMRDYLGIENDDVNSLDGKFDPRRFFCLVGTNPGDYKAFFGLSFRAVGRMSDGLVRSENAWVKDAPRAHVHRSHSGHYGIVNSESGYQNLERFLFGNVRVKGVLEIEPDGLPLPPRVRKAREAGQAVRVSYYFETSVSPRGGADYRLTERRRECCSVVFRQYDELMKPDSDKAPRWPVMFSVYLDSTRIVRQRRIDGRMVRGRTLVFSVELRVSTTAYEVDGFLWNDEIPGDSLYDEALFVLARQSAGKWRLRYYTREAWVDQGRGQTMPEDEGGYYIPLSSRKGFRGRLRLEADHWE